MIHFVIGCITLLSIVILLRVIAYSKPRTVKIIIAVLAVLICLILLRFGTPVIAAVFAGLFALLPVLRKLLSLVYTIYGFKQFFGSHSAHSQSTGKQSTKNYTSGNMSEADAREILGVSKNASAAEIKKAYQDLMKKIHPDKGGSEYFSKRLNEAKDILLKKK